MNRKSFLWLACLWLSVGPVWAQLGASVPYTPSWQARHQLQWLVDHANLPLPVTHWPLPAAAVEQALSALPSDLLAADDDVQHANGLVLRELQQRQQQAGLSLQMRQRAEGLTGFDESHTPGSSVQAVSAEKRADAGSITLAGRLGLRLEQTSNSLATGRSGWGTEGAAQARPEGSAAVLGWHGWSVPAFSHRHWWGPGWQSSLVNGTNSPAWNGVGIQRGSVQPSSSPWLNWMGPWNLDVFVAQAQDPQVVAQQPSGYLFSGMRLTMRPQPWLEVGLSRGLQTAGRGRPAGGKEFVKAFLGQQTNRDPGDPPDSSNQVAGYDVRLRCPRAWGTCAAYTQWMGEDSAGTPPLPYRFMRLWGMEWSLAQQRVFAEYSDTYTTAYQSAALIPGYTNGVYTQGYTNGARWIGSAQGGASRVTTLGWLDAGRDLQLKLHWGSVGLGVGAYQPGVDQPHGQLRGISASKSMHWQGLTWTPELAWTHLSDGQDLGANRRNNLRVGMAVRMPL